MRKKYLRCAFIVYAVILYGFWSLLELYLKQKFGVSEFTKEVFIKIIIWLIPALFLHIYFSDDLFIRKKEMFSLNKRCWILIPIMLLFTVFIIANEYILTGTLKIDESFGISTVIQVFSIAIGEEMVFRAFFLNALLCDHKKYVAVGINSLMFLLIHFPIWIQSNTFISAFTSGGFITVLLLNCIFSFVFIKTKSIWVSVFLHFWWDLLLFML